MDNHLHVLVRLDADAANTWSAEDVVRRWIVAYPPKSADGEEIEVTRAWIDEQAGDEQRVSVLRTRLANLGWFMKALKEPLARLANKEDDCKGTLWESLHRLKAAACGSVAGSRWRAGSKTTTGCARSKAGVGRARGVSVLLDGFSLVSHLLRGDVRLRAGSRQVTAPAG